MSNQLTFVDLSCYSAIDITGVDAAKFLQGQLTINVDSPTDYTSYLAALCNPKGRIVSLFHIVTINDGFRLVMPKSLIEISLSHLKKYGVFFKVAIAESAICKLIGIINFSNQQLQSFDWISEQPHYQLNDLPMAFLPLSAQEDVNRLSNALDDSFELGDENWFGALAKHKVCWLSEQSSEAFLPHNLDLPNQNAVDFKKGCFTGQEVIARMHYKGKLKQKLQLLQSVEVTELGQELLLSTVKQKLLQQESKVGEVICGCLSAEKRWLVLALVKDSANNQQNFTVNTKNSPILELVE